ncbi:MAG: hypothetical protein KF691_01175 [Phycisphaeraceae bacterium]|nr:hypothetical protein [Phycisphaeraceae bacterium]
MRHILACLVTLGVAAGSVRAAWGLKYEVSPNGTTWSSTIAAQSGDSVYFRMSAYFEPGTQVQTTNGIGNAIAFGRFQGQQIITNRVAGDSVTDVVRVISSGGPTFPAVSSQPTSFLIGTTAATSWASQLLLTLDPYIEAPEYSVVLLRGKITLSWDLTPRTLTIRNNVFGTGGFPGLRYYSDAQLSPIEFGPPTDSPNHTDFEATIDVSPAPGCITPVFQTLTGPGNMVPSQTAVFTAAASNTDSYVWLKNGVAIVNDGRVTGANTATLQIHEPRASDVGSYRVWAYGKCELSTLSSAIAAAFTCGGDLNRDGLVDDADFVVFVKSYSQLLCPAPPALCPSDLNLDGFVDDGDFVIFVAQYDQLLCP